MITFPEKNFYDFEVTSPPFLYSQTGTDTAPNIPSGIIEKSLMDLNIRD